MVDTLRAGSGSPAGHAHPDASGDIGDDRHTRTDGRAPHAGAPGATSKAGGQEARQAAACGADPQDPSASRG